MLKNMKMCFYHDLVAKSQMQAVSLTLVEYYAYILMACLQNYVFVKFKTIEPPSTQYLLIVFLLPSINLFLPLSFFMPLFHPFSFL